MAIHRVGGDQKFLEEVLLKNCCVWQDEFPNQIFSYKIHCKGELPENAKIVCFHGRPRPKQVEERHKWIEDAWI